MAKKKGKQRDGLRRAADRVRQTDVKAKLADREKRSARIELRVTTAEKEAIQRLAGGCDVSVTKLLVALVEAATESARDRQ